MVDSVGEVLGSAEMRGIEAVIVGIPERRGVVTAEAEFMLWFVS